MLRPTKPSSAGSSVSAAAIVVSTPIVVPTATPRNVWVLRTSRPSSAMTTVVPGEEHRPSGGVEREDHRVLGLPARRRALRGSG